MTSPLITTLKDSCRMCYTCVRECPAKAIRITDGQAEVIAQRCIGCGNCVQVCSQNAKQVRSSRKEVEQLLESGAELAVCIAPSFPAEFGDVGYRRIVGMLRSLGFHHVVEVSFGADLVALEYRNVCEGEDKKRQIATTCPAVTGFVERYYPDLVESLAPIVSPMVATARVIHEKYGKDVKIVFVGPCIAKKAEAERSADIDQVLTFDELRSMFIEKGIEPSSVEPSEFDPPHGAAGGLFPIGRGLLQAADIREDLLTGEVVATEGRSHVVEAIKEFACGDLGAKLLEALCCEGCIMGAGISNDIPLFSRRRNVRRYVCRRVDHMDKEEWQEEIERYSNIDLHCEFEGNDQRIFVSDTSDIDVIMARMGKHTIDDELNCGACGYDTCREHAIAIHKGLAEREMCMPYTIDQLSKALMEVEASNQELANTQHALIQSEKLASMGQLAADIAHEVNNPLGVVLMYAHLLLDECEEESEVREDLSMIVEQADRCRKIIAGLLNFARKSKNVRQSADLGELVDKTILSLSLPANVTLQVEQDLEDRMVQVDDGQIIQLLTNLANNAIGAMEAGGSLTLSVKGDSEKVYIRVADTGCGIPADNVKKIFEPFFTTKKIGKGTGLGLSVSYGIVKMHGGEIKVESNADPAAGPTGTTFTITLPRKDQSSEPQES